MQVNGTFTCILNCQRLPGVRSGGCLSSNPKHCFGFERKNGEADNVQTDSPHSASRASRKAPHPLLRFSSQNRNDVSVLKGRAAKRTSPRVYTGTASEAARCAPFLRQARKLRICSRLLPDPPESLRWIPSEMRGRERARSDVLSAARFAALCAEDPVFQIGIHIFTPVSFRIRSFYASGGEKLHEINSWCAM